MAKKEYNESPLLMYVGDSMAFSYEWSDTISNPVTTVYKEGEDVSGVVLSGTESSSGGNQTSRVLAPIAADHKSTLIMILKATFNGRTELKSVFIDVLDPAQINA